MEYEITAERQTYLEARGHIILSACPGSGKTTSIVKKLFDVAKYCTEQYGKHAGFACLSFTGFSTRQPYGTGIRKIRAYRNQTKAIVHRR